MQAEFPSPCNLLCDGHEHTRITIKSEPMAVREGLQALFGTAMLSSLPVAARGKAEIVLAEVLNNIVEHAYAEKSGRIDLILELQPPDLFCLIEDYGLPMPGDVLPAGRLRPLTDHNNLPEGGFGWHLIRTLSRDLHYQREGARNRLRFRLDVGQSEI